MVVIICALLSHSNKWSRPSQALKVEIQTPSGSLFRFFQLANCYPSVQCASSRTSGLSLGLLYTLSVLHESPTSRAQIDELVRLHKFPIEFSNPEQERQQHVAPGWHPVSICALLWRFVAQTWGSPAAKRAISLELAWWWWWLGAAGGGKGHHHHHCRRSSGANRQFARPCCLICCRRHRSFKRFSPSRHQSKSQEDQQLRLGSEYCFVY